MDIPALNTLVLASPRREIEQSVGRILRKTKGDVGYVNPMIIDIVDSFYYLYYQGKARQTFYSGYGYKINHIHIGGGNKGHDSADSSSGSESQSVELLTDSETDSE